MEAVSAYQSGCAENDVPVDDYVVRMLQAGPAHLHLSGRARKPAALKALLLGVTASTGIHSISLADNNIDGETCAEVVTCLADTGVTVIDLSNNPIGNAGAAAFADAVQQGTPFASLVFSHCDIDDEGASLLVAAAIASGTLMALDLSRNPISHSGQMAITQLSTDRPVPLALRVDTDMSVFPSSRDGEDQQVDSSDLRTGILTLNSAVATLQERLAEQSQEVLTLTATLDKHRSDHYREIEAVKLDAKRKASKQAQAYEQDLALMRSRNDISRNDTTSQAITAAKPGMNTIDIASQRITPGGPRRADDLIFFPNVDGASAIVSALNTRLEAGRPFAGIGNVLLAVKPPRSLRDSLFRRRTARLYADRRHPHFRLPSHLYRLGRDALEAVAAGKDASIVLVGESGSGKTRAAAELVQFILEGGYVVAADTTLPDVFARCMTMLQAFCHAQTLHNPNASRAARIVDVELGRADPFHEYEVTQVRLSVPLLLPSRLKPQGDGQRTFHIMYWMVAGLPLTIPQLAQQLGLMEREAFMLAPGGIDPDQDAVMFDDLLGAFYDLGLQGAELEALFGALAGVLWLGDAQFVDSENGSAPADPVVVSRASTLLLSDPDLLSHSICGMNVTVEQALARRDAICNEAYDRIVQWVVARLNSCLASCGGRQHGHTQKVILRVIDAPGYEPTHATLPTVVPCAETLAVNYFSERLMQLMCFHSQNAVTLLRDVAGNDGAEKALAGVQAPTNDAILTAIDDYIAVLANGGTSTDAEVRLEGGVARVDDGYLVVEHPWASMRYPIADVAHAASPVPSVSDLLDGGVVPVQMPASAQCSALLRPRLAADALCEPLKEQALFFVACLRPDRPSLEPAGDGTFEEDYLAEQLRAMLIPSLLAVTRRSYPEALSAHDVGMFRAVLGDQPAVGADEDPADKAVEILKAAGITDYIAGPNLFLMPAGAMNSLLSVHWAQLKVFFADDVEQFTRATEMPERANIMRAMLETYFFRESSAVLPLPAHIMDAVLARAQRHPDDPPETLFDNALSALLATKTNWWAIDDVSDQAFLSLRLGS